MQEYSRIILEEYRRTHKSVRSRRIAELVELSYDVNSYALYIQLLNNIKRFDNKSIFYNMKTYYKAHTQKDNGLAGCMECGQCENICPQKISIRKYFGEIKQLFE